MKNKYADDAQDAPLCAQFTIRVYGLRMIFYSKFDLDKCELAMEMSVTPEKVEHKKSLGAARAIRKNMVTRFSF